MGIFFGTDGLRGKVNDDLTYSIAYKCGNALAHIYPKSNILVGRDTRGSGDLFALAFAVGVMNAGSNVSDVGICPTAGIGYLTTKLGYDFGVVISSSHNPSEYNGIKIFDKFGKKLGDLKENEIERHFLKEKVVAFDKVGSYCFAPRLVSYYQKFLCENIDVSLKGKTIVLDCANGASYKIAPSVFKKLGAKIIAKHCTPNGININKKCGSLHIENLQKEVLKNHADMGFAFDGDSDRVIAVDEKGNVVDGDKIIYLFALDYKSQDKLKSLAVVGTRHTNMGVEKALQKSGIELIRTDIGDRYVSQKLIEKNLLIGGEQCGHIFLRDKLPTGDGILNALYICSICAKQNKKLSDFFDFKNYYQTNINVQVEDKIRIINSEVLSDIVSQQEQKIKDIGRIMIRFSGTEPYIRIMVECENEGISKKIANELKIVVENLNKEYQN